MRFSSIFVAAWASLALAQRPANTSVCDYYTTALLKENNSTNQLTLLTLLVNTALIGNYSSINTGVKVNGILNNGTYNGTAVNLLPYFNGMLLSTTRSGKGASVNFLDDGGATPLESSMPSAGNMTSNQYLLITHLYSFFGLLAGCTQVGMTGYPAYGGNTDMYAVHSHMDLNPYQVGYFIQEVGLSALSFGVTMEDATAVGNAINAAFGYKCGPITAIVPGAQNQSQSICQDASCPVAPGASCANVANGTAPMYANGTNFTTPSPSTNGSASGTSASPSSTSKGAAMIVSAGSFVGFAAAFAAALLA